MAWLGIPNNSWDYKCDHCGKVFNVFDIPEALEWWGYNDETKGHAIHICVDCIEDYPKIFKDCKNFVGDYDD